MGSQNKALARFALACMIVVPAPATLAASATTWPTKPVRLIVPFSPGVGSLAHLVGALLDQQSGVRMVHVPYKGAGPGLTDLLAGNINLAYYTAVAVLPHVKSGKLRDLGVTTEKRVDAFPGVPVIGEVVPGFAAEHWYGMWETPGTPPEVIARVNQAIGKMLQVPDPRDRIIADGFVPVHSTPEEYRKRIARDVARWI